MSLATSLLSGAGEGEVVSEVGEEERGAQGGVDRRSDNATSVDVEIDPHCRRLGRSQTDFALQTIVECRAAKAKRVAVLLRWHTDGGEVRRGLVVFWSLENLLSSRSR